MKLSGKECKEQKLDQKWDEQHADHFISKYKHTIYKGSEEIVYDCYLCLFCEEVARVEVGRKKVKLSERRRRHNEKRRRNNNRINGKYEETGEETFFRFRQPGRGGVDDEMHGGMSGEYWGSSG